MFVYNNKLRAFFMVLYAFSSTAVHAGAQNVTQESQYEIKYLEQTNHLLKSINPQNMWAYLTKLTQFPDRASNHESGFAAANWAKSQFLSMAQASGRDDIKVFTIESIGKDPYMGTPLHVKQPSVILKIGSGSVPAIVVGAHIDTQACLYFDDKGGHEDEGCLRDPEGPLPGADDDGTGVATVLETARTIISSGVRFKRPIYFILYAAEEIGEFGSQIVVDYFQKNNLAVKAVLQLDQTGYAYNNDLTMYIESNHGSHGTNKVVDDALSQYLVDLTRIYVKRPVKFTCAGSSDEQSWTDKGFVAARPVETDNCIQTHAYPYIHTKLDTLDKISLTHMTDYLKLAVAFTVEMAEPAYVSR